MITVEQSPDRLISLEEAGRITGLGRSSIYQRLGIDFTAVKLGQRTLLSANEAHKFVADKLQAARNPTP